MSKISAPDQFQALYDLKKDQDPTFEYGMVPVRKKDVRDVDRLVEISRGNRDIVKTEDDWNVLAQLIIFYIERWPEEWMEFRKTMPDIRNTRNDSKKHGYSDSGEIKYVAAIPPRLERLIKVIFPQNQWNKDFSYKFIKKFKIFKVAGA